MNQKLIVIILVGVIVGMLLAVPTIFMSDVFVGGIMVGLLSGVVGHFVLKKKVDETSS